MSIVTKAYGQCGGVSRFAAALSTAKDPVSRQSVHQWIKKGYIPTKYALRTESATNGVVSANEVLIAAQLAEEARR